MVVVKNVSVFKRFFYIHLCRTSVLRYITMESGINEFYDKFKFLEAAGKRIVRNIKQ